MEPRYIVIDFDEEARESLNMAFGKDAELRKKWLVG